MATATLAVGTRQSIVLWYKAKLGDLSHPSPNFGERRGGVRPDIVVLHYTAMTSAQAAARTLCNPETEVSAHYLISEKGEVLSLVDEAMRAWHAGAGRWAGIDDVNSHSIGIELCNDGFSPFSHKLMDALEVLLGTILQRWGISKHRVIAHSDLAPGRKIDPGVRFDWQRLAKADLSVWPVRRSAQPQEFHAAACAFGYRDDLDDATRLAAFRLRFRHGFEGPLDAKDAGLAKDLAERFSVDRFNMQS